MPIGTSSGEYFEDQYEYTVRQPVINPDTDPRFQTQDQNIVTPDQMGIHQQLDKTEQDPSTGTGIPIGLKRVEITGGTIDSTMPLGGSTEPAGALKSSEGSQVPGNEPETKKGFFERLSVVNALRGMMNPDFQGDLNLLKSIGKAVTLPGDVAQGNVDPGSIEAIGRSFDLASIAVLGPTPVAAKMADGTLGSFIGVKAKTFDKNRLAQAQIMEKHGAPGDAIWKETGTFKGADGRWRQEVSDNEALVIGSSESGKLKSLSDVYDHPELYKAYPDLKNLPVAAWEDASKGQYGRASYDAANDVIYAPRNANVSDFAHEVQHAIQAREGFATGGSPAEKFAFRFEEDVRKARMDARNLINFRESSLFKGWTSKQEQKIQDIKRLLELDALRKQIAAAEAESHYMRLAGEVEARNVEVRGPMTAEARSKLSPIWTEDVARSQQHVIDKPMWTTPYGPTATPGTAPPY